MQNAKRLAQELSGRGFRIVSGGTDCHLFSVDLRSKSITGKEAELILDKAGITVNKNTIPYDPQKPMVTSGIRIGTPAITARGMSERDMPEIAQFIEDAIAHKDNDSYLSELAGKIKNLCGKYPVYPGYEN